MKGAIFDIDGVLAETLPRVRIHLWEKTKPDWNAFYADQRYDKPIPWTFTFMRALAEDGYKIALLTGRPGEFRHDTIRWLHENDARYHVLWMRGDKDYRPPQEAKKEQLYDLRKRGWDVELAFEDHPETVQMYMDEGLMVYITPHFFSWKDGEVGRAGEDYCEVGDFECGDSEPGPEPVDRIIEPYDPNEPPYSQSCEDGCPTEYSSDEAENFLSGLEPIEMVASPESLREIETALKAALEPPSGLAKEGTFFDELDELDKALEDANRKKYDEVAAKFPYRTYPHKSEEKPHAVTDID